MKPRVLRTLGALQRHTKTDTKYLAKNGFWLAVWYVVQVTSGTITTIALANLLTKEDMGVYQFVLTVAGILSTLTLSGIGTAMTRGVAKGNDGLLRSAVRIKLKWSLAITISAGVIALYYFYKDNSMLGLSFLIVGTLAPFIESFKMYENFLYGKEAFKDSVTLGAWRKPLPLIATVITAFLYPEPLALVAAYFASNALSFFLVYQSVLKKYNLGISHDTETLTLGKHLSAVTIIGRFAEQADKLLLYHFLGPVAVASYTIAQFGSRYTGGFLNSVTALVLPKLSKRDLTTLQQTLPRKITIFTGVMFVGAGLYIVIAPFLFSLLFPTYPESVIYTQALAITFLFIPRSVYGKALVAHNQVRAQYMLSIINPLANIILLFALLPLYGIWGAIIANLITEAFSSLFVYILFKRARTQPVPTA